MLDQWVVGGEVPLKDGQSPNKILKSEQPYHDDPLEFVSIFAKKTLCVHSYQSAI
jgi:hypothetical protein